VGVLRTRQEHSTVACSGELTKRLFCLFFLRRAIISGGGTSVQMHHWVKGANSKQEASLNL
jgi:hypothetical protein